MKLQPSALPDWPAMMPIELAAAYCSLSEDSFKFVARRHRCQAVDLGLASLRWRRRDLDDLIDKLPLRGAEMAPDVDAKAESPEEAALRRAQRRAR